MTWFREISSAEYLFISFFLLFYLGYAVQMYLISKKIKLSLGRLVLKFILRSSYFGLLLIAFLGPSFGDIKKEIKAIGKDIYIAIDVSASMNANDVNPSRLEKVKFEFSNVLKSFNSDRVGLLIFSEQAFVQCPLTYDQNVFKLFLNGINTSLIPLSSTNLAIPLSLVHQKFLSTDKNNPLDQAKVLVLVTDGEDFSNQSLEPVLTKIKNANIKIVVLGVGSEKGSTIPMGKGLKLDENGLPVISVLQKQKLKNIAKIAGGNYYEITPDKNEMKKLVQKIINMEGMLKGTQRVESSANKYLYFLFIALVLVVIDILITVKTIKI